MLIKLFLLLHGQCSGELLKDSPLYGLDPHSSQLDDWKDMLVKVSRQARTLQNPCSEVFWLGSCAMVDELANRSHGERHRKAGSEADNHDKAPSGFCLPEGILS